LFYDEAEVAMPADTQAAPATLFTPAFPGYAAKVERAFANQGMLGAMGARLAMLEPGRCAIELPFKSELTQQQGFFHGGAIGAIADTACGFAAFTLMPEEAEILTVEYKINLVKAARPPLLRAEGLVMRAGRTITVCRAEVYRVDGDVREICAVMQATMMRVEPSA
jgi:uncharacterized protein (TIGR00369 family)